MNPKLCLILLLVVFKSDCQITRVVTDVKFSCLMSFNLRFIFTVKPEEHKRRGFSAKFKRQKKRVRLHHSPCSSISILSSAQLQAQTSSEMEDKKEVVSLFHTARTRRLICNEKQLS